MEPLKIGTYVYTGLYGTGKGIIYHIHGEQEPKTVRQLFPGLGTTGGNARFDIVFLNGTRSTRLPESHLRASVQWQVLDHLELADAETIEQALAYAAACEEKKRIAEEHAKRDFDAEVERIKTDAEYNHMIQKPNTRQFTQNIKRDLQKKYPGVKFSVRMSSHSSVLVSFPKDAPIINREVYEYLQRFTLGDFDGMEDCYKYKKTPFNEIFSGVRYINTTYTN